MAGNQVPANFFAEPESAAALRRCDVCREVLPHAWALTVCSECKNKPHPLEAVVPREVGAVDRIAAKVERYRAKYFGRDPSEAITLIAMEEVNERFAEAFGEHLAKAAEDAVKTLAAAQRPTLHHGEVLGQFYNELTQLIREHQALRGFEARVVEAAKSPAAWLQLRQELAK